MVKKLYRDGKKKAITFSFDDGTPQDVRLIKIMNKYGIKGTFNLIGCVCQNRELWIKTDEGRFWDGSDYQRAFYAGHEIASHSYTHPHLSELDGQTRREEIEKDVAALSTAFGCKIRGYASPYGEYVPELIPVLKENGICYQRPLGKATGKRFSLPEDFYRWIPDGHFSLYSTDEGKAAIDSFFACTDELACLYIWGHSYEINELNAAGFQRWHGMGARWDYAEELCRTLSGHEDVWYATNIEICEYATAMRKAHFDDTYIDNPTDITLFFEVDGKVIAAPPHARFDV